MTRRRISNRTPRELTAKERSALSDVVLELDSDFRVKTGSVDNISLETPVPGVIVLNEYDGKVYYADNYGWHQQGALWSPITLFVEFNGTDQFDFKFKAPADSADPSTLIIHDGDGTITEVDGNDATEVTHTTNYSEAGTYYFYVLGDVLDITYVRFAGAFVSGDASGWSVLSNLTYIRFPATSMYGDVSGYSVLTSLEHLNVFRSNIRGDISGWSTLINLTFLASSETIVTFDNISLWDVSSNLNMQDCNWTSKMVDNALKSFVNLTGVTINIGGNNAARTSASDAAFAIVDAANTLTVNE